MAKVAIKNSVPDVCIDTMENKKLTLFHPRGSALIVKKYVVAPIAVN